MKKRNYHMSMSPVNRAIHTWRCDYCGKIDHIDNLNRTDCTHVYKVCDACGGSETSNECRPDCRKIFAALANPTIYIAGGPDLTRKETL